MSDPTVDRIVKKLYGDDEPDPNALVHQYHGTLPTKAEVLVNVYVDGTATLQFRRHDGAGWGEATALERREV
jgi:hypothetical protein